mgnify:FL=1
MNFLHLFYIIIFFKSQILMLPILYLFYIQNGLSWNDYFLFQGLSLLLNIFLQIPLGFISNFVSKKYYLIISCLFLIVSRLIWLFYSGYYAILMGELIFSISKSFYEIIEAPYLYEILKKYGKTSKMLQTYSQLNFFMWISTGISGFISVGIYAITNFQILMITEIVLFFTSLFLSFKLPNIKPKAKSCLTCGLFPVTIGKINIKLILSSAVLSAFSQFFFWSFQPILAIFSFPLTYFGWVIFINNIFRAFGCLANKYISQLLTMKQMIKLCFLCTLFCFIFVIASKNYMLFKQWCLILIFLLCISITIQLMFKIRVSTYLQNKASASMKTSLNTMHVFITKLFTAILLILPKYQQIDLGVFQIYNVYFCVFICLILLFFAFDRYNKQNYK